MPEMRHDADPGDETPVREERRPLSGVRCQSELCMVQPSRLRLAGGAGKNGRYREDTRMSRKVWLRSPSRESRPFGPFPPGFRFFASALPANTEF